LQSGRGTMYPQPNESPTIRSIGRGRSGREGVQCGLVRDLPSEVTDLTGALRDHSRNHRRFAPTLHYLIGIRNMYGRQYSWSARGDLRLSGAGTWSSVCSDASDTVLRQHTLSPRTQDSSCAAGCILSQTPDANWNSGQNLLGCEGKTKVRTRVLESGTMRKLLCGILSPGGSLGTLVLRMAIQRATNPDDPCIVPPA
jgi:hypothetical protein